MNGKKDKDQTPSRSEEKRKKMDSFRVRYRIYIKGSHKVILSRDVTLQEKPGNYREEVKLPLKFWLLSLSPDGHNYTVQKG